MFTRDRIEKAVEIAVAHGYSRAKNSNENKKDLFNETLVTHRVYLLVIMHNMPPEPSDIPKPIILPHPIFPPASTLAGIVEGKDLQLAKSNPSFNKVITIEDMRDVHFTFQSRRELVKAYDVYACNTDLYELILKHGGKSFTCKHTVVCTDKSMKVVDKDEVVRTTQFRDPRGTNLSIKVGYFNTTNPDKSVRKGLVGRLTDNVLEVIKSFDKTLPGEFKNCKVLAINLVPGQGLPNIPFYESVLPEGERIFDEHPIRPADPLDIAINELYRDLEDQGMIDEEMKEFEPRMSKREREKAGLPRIRGSKAGHESDKHGEEKEAGDGSSKDNSDNDSEDKDSD